MAFFYYLCRQLDVMALANATTRQRPLRLNRLKHRKRLAAI